MSLLPGPLVLRISLPKFNIPTVDRDRTVSRRSKPSSRTILIGDQPNSWSRFRLRALTSRHRGANQFLQ
jgi:hypothetical protein